MNYTTLSSLKMKLWIATDNTESDSELSLIIERATKLIDIEIWFNLEKRNISERVDWTWKNRIYLKNKPNSIINIKSKDWFTSYILDYIDWYILHLEENTPKWNKNILVDYEFWFDSENIPGDIEEICLDLCVIISDVSWINGTNMEKLIDKNIKTQKLWELSITYFWETEKTTLSSFEKLNPGKNIEKILNKYKSFNWIT